MAQDKAEDAGGLSPAKDDNAALRYFNRRTLPIFRWVDYILSQTPRRPPAGPGGIPSPPGPAPL